MNESVETINRYKITTFEYRQPFSFLQSTIVAIRKQISMFSYLH